MKIFKENYLRIPVFSMPVVAVLSRLMAYVLLVGLTSCSNTRIDDPSTDRSITLASSALQQRPNLTQSDVLRSYGRLPLGFEANRGQTDGSVRFISRGAGYTLFLSPADTVLATEKHANDGNANNVIHTQLLGADKQAVLEGVTELPGKVNYLIGRTRADWHTGIPLYREVRAKDIYPGVDLRYHGDRERLEFDFIVKPGADSSAIQLALAGADRAVLDDKGDLVLTLNNDTLRYLKPQIYQDIDGRRVSIDGRYRLNSPSYFNKQSLPLPAEEGRGEGQIQVGFQVATYNPDYPLIIDPVLNYATYLGGEQYDNGLSIAVDDSGAAYIAGTTSSLSFPVHNAVQSAHGGNNDSFIVKLTPAGDALVYATYLGGSADEGEPGEDGDSDEDIYDDEDDDIAQNIAVDSQGQVVITDTTASSTDFPLVNAIQSSFGGGPRDAYIAKLSADGASLIYSSFLGGSKHEKGMAVVLDAADNAYITGVTYSTNFPTVNALQSASAGNRDAFVLKLPPNGGQLLFSTYLGGQKADQSRAIALDANGDIYLTGWTRSSNNFPISSGAAQALYGGGDRDAFITKISNDGQQLLYSTFLGGQQRDRAGGIVVDDSGAATVTGWTYSATDFPVTAGAVQTTYGGGTSDAFITRLNPAGSALEYSTYLGGSNTDKARAISRDKDNNIYVTGYTNSVLDFPQVNPLQPQAGGGIDAFVVKLLADGSTLDYATYFGGSNNDRGQGIAVDSTGAAYITGMTRSDLDFPILNAVQPQFGGGSRDAFVAKLGPDNLPPEITSDPVTTVNLGESYSYQVEATDPDNDTLSYSLDVFPDGMTIDANSGLISWTPATSQLGANDVTVVVDDGKGGTVQQTFQVNVIDVTPPVITVDYPPNGLLTNQSVITVSGHLNEQSTLTINGNPATVNADLTFSGTATLVQGNNVITLSATDVAGNTSSLSINVTLDTIAPVISVTSPTDGGITNQTAITVSGSLSEPASLTINGQPVPVEILGNSFSYGPLALTEGENTITLVAVDAAGNAGQAVLTVTSDSIAPVITVTQPQDGSYTNQPPLTITGSLSELADLTLNGAAVTVNPDLSFSVGPVTLNEGANSFTLVATDAATNATTQTVSVTLDTVAPVLTLTTPANDTLTTNPDVTFSGSISEPVHLTINGTTVTQNADNSFSAAITLAEGANTVDVIAADNAGNTDTKTVTVTVDTTPPAAPDLNQITRGNPMDGIVSVNGNPDAVENGTLVYITNATSGKIAMDLAQTDGSFTAEIAAFANDDLAIYAIDAAGNKGASAILGPATPTTLTLNPVGDKIAPLGTITRFTVTANDSSGNPITLGLTPLPLPDNMEYNIETGEFSFQPDANQAGDYTLTFSALTGSEKVTETIHLSVPPADPNAPTVFTGRILDANSMAVGNIVPIVGATVTFLETGEVVTTDGQGFFTLNNLPSTATVFDIDGSTAQPAPDGSGYASFREGLPVISNVTNQVERPFYMPRLATESLTTVDPNQTTMVDNPTLGVSLEIPPHTAIWEADGSEFTGQISISEVPRDLAPGNLPEFMDPKLLVTIQPIGVSYATPVPITFTNTENYSPGSEVDIWSVDPDLGQFVVVGTGKVTDDGQFVETIAGGIRANDWHSVLPPGTDSQSNQNNQDQNNPQPCCPQVAGGSQFSMHDGSMALDFSLPAYRSLETSRALTFNYRSFSAWPRPVVEFNGEVNVRSTIPKTVSYQLKVAGLDQGQEVFVDTSGFSESLTEPFRTAISFDASDFTSGSYPYSLQVTGNFFGNGTRRSTFINGVVMVQNEQHSSFGAGWSLGGLYRLAFNDYGTDTTSDDSVTLIASDGNSVTYQPTGVPGEFNEPDDDYAVFQRNADGTYTHTEKDGVQMHFNAAGQLSDTVDRNGNTTTYAYDTAGKLISITDPVGLATTFAYNVNGLLETATDPASRATSFVYDPLGNLVKVTYPDGTFETFEYDGHHLMTAHEDTRHNRSEDSYDNFGRVVQANLPDGTVRSVLGKTATGLVDVSAGIGTETNPAPVTRPDDVKGTYTDGRGNSSSKTLDSHGRSLLQVDEVGRVTTNVRDVDSNPTETTRPNNSVVNRVFDPFGNVLSQTEQFNGATTSYTYDQFSLVTSVTNPNNHTTTINRDPVTGNPLSIVDALGHTTTMEYDSRGLVTKVTSANGLVTDYTYNTQGLLETKTVTPPSGSPGNVRVTQYSYFPTGLLQTVTTPDGITLNYTYDDRSRLISVTDNLNQSIHYEYDDYGNVIRTETSNSDGSLALLVESVYDERNRLSETKAPHGTTEESITQRILDENSNLTGLVDPNGNPSSNVYDAANRLQNNTHREGGVTQYVYDNLDRITKVIAANGATTQYEYDSLGRRTKEISPDRGTLTYTYDQANNVTSITDGRGITVTMTYDELERITSKTYPNTIAGKNENVTYTYDICNFGVGMLCGRTDESGSYNYAYDGFGNVVSQTFTEQGGVAYNQSYVYDDGDHVTQMTVPSGRVVNYSRDGVRRVSAIDTTVNGSLQNIIGNITYRGDNQVIGAVFGNGLTDTRDYDLQGRLTHQALSDGATAIDSRDYSYDKNSNILNIDTNVEDNAYGYDKLDRLTADTIDSNSPVNFSYDLNDNRLTRQSADGVIDAILDHADGTNRLELADTVQTGTEPISDMPDRDLVYNDAGRLFQIIQEGVLKAEYIYNDEGQRTRKTVYQADGITVDHITVYHYDKMGYLVTETDDQGNLIKDYIWQEGMHPVAQIDNTQGTENVLYLYTDHLMTARLATDQTQSVVWRWEGEAFGNTPAQELAGYNINLRFPGQYYDQEMGLHYNYFRDYDPTIGRYIEPDPIGIMDGDNIFEYVSNNPPKFIDLSGSLHTKPSQRRAESTDVGLVEEAGIFCDGHGGFEIVYFELNKCWGDCLRKHELKHLSDFRRDAPNICRNKRPNERVKYDSKVERAKYEHSAYLAEYECLIDPKRCIPEDCYYENLSRKRIVQQLISLFRGLVN